MLYVYLRYKDFKPDDIKMATNMAAMKHLGIFRNKLLGNFLSTSTAIFYSSFVFWPS